MKPLTLLVGPNGSGKTAALESLGLLSQTADAQSNQDGFSWRGRWADFGPNGLPAFHKGKANVEIRLGVTFDSRHLPPEPTESRASYSSDDDSEPPAAIEYIVHHIPKKRYWQHVCQLDDQTKAVNTLQPSPASPALIFENADIDGVYVPQATGGAVFSPQLYQTNGISLGTQAVISSGQRLNEAKRLGSRFSTAISYLRQFLKDHVYLVGPSRLPRSEEQNLQKYDLSVGRSGEDTLNLLSYLFASPEHDTATERIQHWAKIFGLGGLRAGWARQQELQAGFTDPQTKTALRLEYSGYGSQQILPVITQIFAAPKGSIILIEEPEISLHPEAHVDLIKLFADGIKFGQQIVITTHSSTLPLALAEAEAFGLKPKDVSIHHLRRERGSIQNQKLELDEKWFIRGWIPSFSTVEQDLLKKWMERVQDDISSKP